MTANLPILYIKSVKNSTNTISTQTKVLLALHTVSFPFKLSSLKKLVKWNRWKIGSWKNPNFCSYKYQNEIFGNEIEKGRLAPTFETKKVNFSEL